MWRLMSAAVRANTSSRSSEAFTSSPITVSVASTSGESSGAGLAASVSVCASVGFMQVNIITGPIGGPDEPLWSVARMRASWLFRLRSQREHTDVREVAVALGVIQAVADHEFVGDGEANVIGADFREAARWFIEQHGHAQTSGLPLIENAQQILERHARVQNIFDDDDRFPFDAGVQIAREFYFSRGVC